MNKTFKIINEVYYWKELLKIPYFVLNVDNKMKYAGCVNEFNKQIACLTLNLKYLEQQAPISVLAIIFHEFGHLKSRTCFKEFKGTPLESEIIAEKFAIKNMKKFCSEQDYNVYVKLMKHAISSNKWKKTFPIHTQMFKKLYK